MNNSITATREACESGMMPSLSGLQNMLRAKTGLRINLTLEWDHGREWRAGRYLNALFAMQETIWPGSQTRTIPFSSDYKAAILLPRMIVVGGARCPTLACAWLDAILAGLQTEKRP